MTNRINPKPRTEYAPRRQAPTAPGNRPRPARKRCATQQAGHPPNTRSTAGPQARQHAERATAETGLTQNTSRHSPSRKRNRPQQHTENALQQASSTRLSGHKTLLTRSGPHLFKPAGCSVFCANFLYQFFCKKKLY